MKERLVGIHVADHEDRLPILLLEQQPVDIAFRGLEDLGVLDLEQAWKVLLAYGDDPHLVPFFLRMQDGPSWQESRFRSTFGILHSYGPLLPRPPC